MIEVKNVMKQYGNHAVLEGCSITVNKGTIYALAGVNGAGKTTLMKLTAGFLEPTMGTVSVKGMPVWSNKEKIQRYIGSLIEAPVFYEHLSARENLMLHIEYMGVAEDIEKMLRIVGLGEINEKPVSSFSLGMRQRLAIARTLLHEPELLILDEPFNGLDPVAAAEMKMQIRQCADRGMMDTDWKFLSMLVSCVTLAEFTILGAVMNARVTLEEYTGKKVLLLFSYPIDRRAMFRTKAAICWGVTSIGAFVGNMAAILTAGGISNLFHIMPKGFGWEELDKAFYYSVTIALLAGCVGLISLWFGFWKSSVIVEIISALIMIMPITNMFSAQIVFNYGMLIIVLIALLVSTVVYKKLELKIRSKEVI